MAASAPRFPSDIQMTVFLNIRPEPTFKTSNRIAMINIQKNVPLKRSAQPIADPTQRIASLKELMLLEEERISVESNLASLDSRISVLHGTLLNHSASRPYRARLRDRGNAPAGYDRRRMGRGELRSRILELLQTAGNRGVRVQEVASVLTMKSVNIHSWFHTAQRRFPQIQKIGPSRYRLNGPVSGLEGPSADEPSNHLAEGVSGSQSQPQRRGEVTRRILQALKEAGPDGITVTDLALKTGSQYRNIHVWLSSTGKRDARIVRAARGVYKFVESASGSSQDAPLTN